VIPSSGQGRRGTTTRPAFLVRIGGIVLELVGEADVVHLFEDCVLLGAHAYRSAKSCAVEPRVVSGHGVIMSVSRAIGTSSKSAPSRAHGGMC
jgi:hypothetical protein